MTERTQTVLLALLLVVLSGGAGFLGGWFGGRAAVGEPGTTIAATTTTYPYHTTDGQRVWCLDNVQLHYHVAQSLVLDWRTGPDPLDVDMRIWDQTCLAAWEAYR